ncbi:MAG: glycine cleavage system protein GcvH [Candidatus Hermodarchaeota archaeon]
MVKVFFSYATKDSEKFQIPKLAQLLKSKPGIEKVYYWEKHASGSIIEYMEKNVKASDTCVFFYSSVAKASRPVQMERDMAVYQDKHIIPVFMDINDVPEIIKIMSGVNTNKKTSEKIVDEIYRLITEKFNIIPLSTDEQETVSSFDSIVSETDKKGELEETIPPKKTVSKMDQVIEDERLPDFESTITEAVKEELKIPDNLRYSKKHLWVLKLGDGNVKIGITDYAQKKCMEIVFVELDFIEGDEIEVGDEIGIIESVKSVNSLITPISGTIVSFNEGLEDEPESINLNPYDAWIIILRPGDNFKREYAALMDATEYKKIL